MKPRLVIVEVLNLNELAALNVIPLDHANGIERLQNRPEIIEASWCRWFYGVLDGKSISLETAEVVGVSHKEVKQCLGKLSQAWDLLVEPRAALRRA